MAQDIHNISWAVGIAAGIIIVWFVLWVWKNL